MPNVIIVGQIVAALFVWIATKMVTMKVIKLFSKRLMEDAAIVEINRLGKNKAFVKITLESQLKFK